MIQVVNDEIKLNLEEKNETKDWLVCWKKIKDLRDWVSASLNTPMSMEVGAERLVSWDNSVGHWHEYRKGVQIQVAEVQEVKEHNDSGLDRVRMLKYLKMLELKSNKLITGPTGDEVKYASYLKYGFHFISQALLLSLLFPVPENTHSQWPSSSERRFPNAPSSPRRQDWNPMWGPGWLLLCEEVIGFLWGSGPHLLVWGSQTTDQCVIKHLLRPHYFSFIALCSLA